MSVSGIGSRSEAHHSANTVAAVAEAAPGDDDPAAAAEEGEEDAEGADEARYRWCCVRDMDVTQSSPFAMRCATELGFLSVTTNRSVAVEAAMKTVRAAPAVAQVCAR